VQEPIRPADSWVGQLFSVTADLNLDSGVDRSGVNGPFICGSRVDRSIVTSLSYSAFRSAVR